SIVKGENIPEPSIPESFKVLLKEIQALSLDANVVSEEGSDVDMHDDEDDLLEAAEKLGIELSGVRAEGEGAADEKQEGKESEDEDDSKKKPAKTAAKKGDS
ncbi:MAG: hypothetical protein ACXWD7_04025, partial [Solirubrobacterales bacterium]